MEFLVYASVMSLLAIAVVLDISKHRIPNSLILCGLALSLIVTLLVQGSAGLGGWALGITLGGLLFVPLYALGGMAAGDVKLMAVVGGHLGTAVLWAGAFSLISGLVLGLIFLAYKKGLAGFLQRYWLMANTRSYLPASREAVERQRFPYALAIFTGTATAIVLSGG